MLKIQAMNKEKIKQKVLEEIYELKENNLMNLNLPEIETHELSDSIKEAIDLAMEETEKQFYSCITEHSEDKIQVFSHKTL